VAGGWRRLHNEELHNLYSSQNVRVIKSMRMGLVGYAARTGKWEAHTKVCSENLKAIYHSEEQGVVEKVLMEWALRI